MVHYVVTPWRDRHELLMVRQHFYPDQSPTTTAAHDSQPGTQRDQQRQKKAVSRVAMWMHRGNCPHMVESTALLVAATLSDEDAAGDPSAAYAVRAAYSAAFSRFVTGLLDSHQDKQRKMSMYAVAKTLGLPPTFVELRHQATHEQLPSLTRLRPAARKALAWIWDYYWAHLGDNESDEAACRTALARCVEEEVDDVRLRRLMKRWDEVLVLRLLAEMGEAVDGAVVLRCVRLSRAILGGMTSERRSEQENGVEEGMARDVGQLKAELAESRAELGRLVDEVTMKDPEDIQQPEVAAGETGWSRYEGVWKPKPIGMV